MIKVFIIEDEKILYEELCLLLNVRQDIEIVGYCGSIKEALVMLPKSQIDLVLMDIQLTDGKSFEIVEKLSHINFDIVFITAYNHFAIKAIKVGAIDYLLKPIDANELYQVLDNFTENKQRKLNASQKELLLQHTKEDIPVKNLVIKTMNEIFFVSLLDIVYYKGQGNYTTFYLQNNTEITSSKRLKEYEDLLSKHTFIKTHQSYVVNKNYVSHYSNNGELILKNGGRIPVSFRKKETVINQLSML